MFKPDVCLFFIHQFLYFNDICLVVWNHGILWLSIQLGMSSSQLTFTPWFFRGVSSNRQPDILMSLSGSLTVCYWELPSRNTWLTQLKNGGSFHMNHHFPMVFPWFSHGFPMVFPLVRNMSCRWRQDIRATLPKAHPAESRRGGGVMGGNPRGEKVVRWGWIDGWKIWWFQPW